MALISITRKNGVRQAPFQSHNFTYGRKLSMIALHWIASFPITYPIPDPAEEYRNVSFLWEFRRRTHEISVHFEVQLCSTAFGIWGFDAVGLLLRKLKYVLRGHVRGFCFEIR